MLSRTLPGQTDEHRPLAPRAVAALVPRRLALAGILLLALVLNGYQLDRLGYGNLYYAAGVRSMLTSWHAFYFAAYDAGGYVSIDKPPVGLWVQAASAKLFGYNGLSLLLPQALAAVGSVAILYRLVGRAFGPAAGLLAALALAVTPIGVAAARNNTADQLLVLVLLLAAWATVRATETGRLGWLLLGMALVGVGFNIKMLQAYLVLPALGLLYLVAVPVRPWRRLLHLGAAGATLAVVSLAWAVSVDLTPADQRPYVGSSEDNSAVGLALGYNGLDRLIGNGPGGGGGWRGWLDRLLGDVGSDTGRPAGDAPAAQPATAAATGSPVSRGDGGAAPPGGGPPGTPPGGFGGPGGGGETGTPGLTRLFNRQLGGQIAWLLPLALLGGLAVAWRDRPRFEPRTLRVALDAPGRALLLWGGWLLTAAAFFSVAGFFHRYYLVMLGPPVAALAGAGIVTMWRAYRARSWQGWLLPVAVAVTAAVQVYLLRDEPVWRDRLAVPIGGCTLALVLLLLAGRLCGRPAWLRRPGPALVLGVPALLLAPLAWSVITVREGTNSVLPFAGPSQAGGFGGPPRPDGDAAGFGGPGGDSGADPALIEFLRANRADARFLVATPSSMQASPLIIATGEPVMAIGGFAGGDPILDAEGLAELVRDGTVRFFLIGGPPTPGGGGVRPPVDAGAGWAPPPGVTPVGNGGAMPGGGRLGGAGTALAWVVQSCAPVAAETAGRAGQLFDCAARRG